MPHVVSHGCCALLGFVRKRVARALPRSHKRARGLKEPLRGGLLLVFGQSLVVWACLAGAPRTLPAQDVGLQTGLGEAPGYLNQDRLESPNERTDAYQGTSSRLDRMPFPLIQGSQSPVGTALQEATPDKRAVAYSEARLPGSELPGTELPGTELPGTVRSEAGLAESGQAGSTQPAIGKQEPLPLAPPSSTAASADGKSGYGSGGAMLTVFGSLAVVLGAFFLVVWLARRAMPKAATGLPREALEILGQSPLHGRQYVQLLRVGNKLLLVALSPGGVQTLTEITDVSEVERLGTLCRGSHAESVTAAFRQVLGQFGQDAGASRVASRSAGQPGVRRRRPAIEV